MTTLGSCLIANDTPFSGMAQDIFQRRVDGKSWKEIADEFSLGSPDKARKTFTKLTGITDYKIKGNDLLNLAKGGIDPKLLAPKIKIPKTKTEVHKENLNVTHTRKKVGHPKEDDILKLQRSGKTYQQIAQETGVNIADIDNVVWNDLKNKHNGNLWKAHKEKPTSQIGIKEVQQSVHNLRTHGFSIKDTAKALDMPEDAVQKMLAGQWKPSPFAPPLPGHPSYKPPTSAYHNPRPQSRFHSDDFPLLSDADMRVQFPTQRIPDTSSVQYYTGSGYRSINGYLRNGNIPEYGGTTDYISGAISKLDKAMHPSVGNKPFVVSRGMNIDGFGRGFIGDGKFETIKENLEGTIFRDRGFLSTSIAPEGTFHNQVRLVIECPPGTKGAYVQPISDHKSEYEFLMARDTPIMITEVVSEGGNKFLVRGRVVV